MFATIPKRCIAGEDVEPQGSLLSTVPSYPQTTCTLSRSLASSYGDSGISEDSVSTIEALGTETVNGTGLCTETTAARNKNNLFRYLLHCPKNLAICLELGVYILGFEELIVPACPWSS